MTGMQDLSTVQVARLLGVKPGRLGGAVWNGRLPRPAKVHSGAFLWQEIDTRRACWALLHRDLDAVLAERTAEGGER